jgi:hypothetical protein
MLAHATEPGTFSIRQDAARRVTTTAHQTDLLAHGRCGRCAERVPRARIVRRATCPHCESELTAGGDILEELETRRIQWRLVGYGLVAAASFAAGAIPLLQVAVQLAALFILHVIVLRRGLLWLPPGRRILARVTIKLMGAAIAMVALLVNVAIAPLVGVSALILAAVGPLLTAAYVEGGLAILRQRLRWEAGQDGLRTIEWALPAVLVVLLFAALAGTVGVVMWAVHLLATAEIPTVSELSTILLELAP